MHVREIPLESNRPALQFADRLIRGEIDLVVFLTGIGFRALLEIVGKEHDTENFLQSSSEQAFIDIKAI